MRTRIVAAAAIALLATASFATADSSLSASAKAEWLAQGSPATPVVPLAPSAPSSADSLPSTSVKAEWLAHGSPAAPVLPLTASTPGNIWDNGAANGLDGLRSERDTSQSGSDGPMGQDASNVADDFEITEPTTITEIRACFLTTASTRAHLTIYTDSGSNSPALPVTAPLWGAPTTAAIITNTYNDSTSRCPDALGFTGREFVFSPVTTGVTINLAPGHYWLLVVGDGQGDTTDNAYWATSTPGLPLANGVWGSTTFGVPFWTDASGSLAPTPPQFAFDIDGYGSEHIWDNGAANASGDGLTSERDTMISGTGGPTGQDGSTIADDFRIIDQTSVTEIRACFLVVASTRAHLTIYKDSGSDSPAPPITVPLWGAPTTAAITSDSYNDNTARCPDAWGFIGREFVFSPATTGVSIHLAPGHYWLSVVGDGQGNTSDRAFWVTSSPAVPLANGVIGSTYFGNPYWTDVATLLPTPHFAFYIDGHSTQHVWDNGRANNLNGLRSERDGSFSGTDGPTGLDAADTADDFEITEPTTITEIRACFYTNASTRAHLTIYEDSGIGSPALPVTAPLWGAPTTAAITTDIYHDYNDGTARCPDNYGYTGREFVFSPATTGVTIDLAAGHYWLLVVGDGQGDVGENNFWATSTPGVALANGVFGSTAFGAPFWTDATTQIDPHPPQFAFYIDGYVGDSIFADGFE